MRGKKVPREAKRFQGGEPLLPPPPLNETLLDNKFSDYISIFLLHNLTCPLLWQLPLTTCNTESHMRQYISVCVVCTYCMNVTANSLLNDYLKYKYLSIFAGISAQTCPIILGHLIFLLLGYPEFLHCSNYGRHTF